MPVHNRAHMLDQVLGKLAENTTYDDVELIAVDDGSTDESRAILHGWAESGRIPGMRVIEGTAPGAIASLNTALDAATGELCVQLDDDLTIETHAWIERLLDLMLFDPVIGVVSPKVVHESGELQTCGVDVVGPWGWHERSTQPSEPIGRRQFISRTVGRMREGQGGELENRVAEVDSGIGCCMMYRRDDALEVGGYDSRWAPVWFDDVDLCLKIRAVGRKVFYTPEVRTVHHFGTRIKPESRLPRWSPRRIRGVGLRIVGRRLPPRLMRSIERRFDFDVTGDYNREQCRRLRRHHEYWREKWGWHALNPDMDEVLRRWGGTEVCWRFDPERRGEGERIAAAYEERRAASGAAARS
jgi:GT2 family glycosyltransferase